MNKKIISLVVLILFLLGIGFIIKNNNLEEGYLEDDDLSQKAIINNDVKVEGDTTKNAVDNTNNQVNNPSSVEKIFSMEEVAKHNDKNSCYSAIRGEVFDLTSAINTHPGGPDKILSLCGKDGTNAFVNKHGGSPRQENGLEKLKIGILK